LVTASLDIWVKPFAEELKMQLVSTRAEFKTVFSQEILSEKTVTEKKNW
jgi:phosphoserine phosphatase